MYYLSNKTQAVKVYEAISLLLLNYVETKYLNRATLSHRYSIGISELDLDAKFIFLLMIPCLS